MIYKHQHFQLDANSKKVFDENGKELSLTGNAYRVLVFLCSNGSANLTQLGEFLDWAKDYTENHIRQYRYKVNTIIGKNVVEYKNGMYSLIGEIKKANKIERNTDLLQSDPVKLEASIMKKENNIKFSNIPAIIAVAILLLSFFDWTYGYYTLLRIVVTGVAIYYAYYLFRVLQKQDFWFWILIGIAILFNPIVPIYLYDKSVWGIIDIITAIFFLVLILKYGSRKTK